MNNWLSQGAFSNFEIFTSNYVGIGCSCDMVETVWCGFIFT